MAKRNHKDNLDGILLGVYEQEIERLSKETLQNLRYLMSQGIIAQEDDSAGKTWYKIIENSRGLSSILKKFGL